MCVVGQSLREWHRLDYIESQLSRREDVSVGDVTLRCRQSCDDSSLFEIDLVRERLSCQIVQICNH